MEENPPEDIAVNEEKNDVSLEEFGKTVPYDAGSLYCIKPLYAVGSVLSFHLKFNADGTTKSTVSCVGSDFENCKSLDVTDHTYEEDLKKILEMEYMCRIFLDEE